MILRLCFFVLLFLTPFAARAEDVGGSLHVVRPSIDAAQDTGELCLELDHALPLSDRASIIVALHLEADGKSAPLPSSNVSLTANTICLQSLDYRQDYRLTVSGLKGAAGEKLTEPYTLSFTIPDRRAALAFGGSPEPDGLVRYRDEDPVLRSINVMRAKVELYRITDPAMMVSAYRQRQQASLAPSESLTFARDKGQLVWQGELVFDADDKFANSGIDHTLPLRAATGASGALQPGLYLVAATDVDKHSPPKDVSDKDKADKDKAELAPLAAQWFLSSDLCVRALRKRDGFVAVAENRDASAVREGVKFVLFDADQQNLADGKSGTDGLGFLPFAPVGRDNAVVLSGTDDAGNADFADLAANDNARFTIPALHAELITDRAFYFPGAKIHMTIALRNVHGEAMPIGGGTVVLQRPDGSAYTSLPVPEGKSGFSQLSFSAPVSNGAWIAVWHRADGFEVARVSLRVTSNPAAPRIEVEADHDAINGDGTTTIWIKSLSASGAPTPYIAGQILAKWISPDALSGWDVYHFGDTGSDNKPFLPAATFLTDANGTATIHLALKPPGGDDRLKAAIVNVESDPAAGALDPQTLTLRMKADAVVGIRPLVADGKFPENGLARFDVIALDGENKRRDLSDLAWQIYAEGRNFAWYQADGRWDYKQLESRRRLGGGPLAIKASAPSSIRWPVTSGAYTLEIIDANGALLAQQRFDAGWTGSQTASSQTAALDLETNGDAFTIGQPAKLSFMLDHPSTVTAVIADDHIRKVIHEARATGTNELSFTPEKEWGARISVSVLANTGEQEPPRMGKIELPLRHVAQALAIDTVLPDHAEPGKDLALAVTVGNIADAQQASVNVTAVPMSSDVSLLPPDSVTASAETGAEGRATVSLAVPEFSGTLHIRINAADPVQSGVREFSIPVRPVFGIELALPKSLVSGDAARLSLVLANNDAVSGPYRVVLSASGLKLSGMPDRAVALASGASKTISFELRALAAGTMELQLDVSGPHGLHLHRSWPVTVLPPLYNFDTAAQARIEAQQAWTLPADAKIRGKTEATALFLGAAPLFYTPQMLARFVHFQPSTISEMAAWLETERLWRGVIADAGFLPASALSDRRKEIFARLLRVQKPDGSYSETSGDADLTTTADALTALARADDPAAKPAIELAAGWIQRRLANTWFEENERAPRAAGFAALAAAQKLDVAALRYFAETSADKELPPRAAAELAETLEVIGDSEKAAFWLKAAQKKADLPLDALPALSENALLNVDDLFPVLENIARDETKAKSSDFASVANFLRAEGTIQNRAGAFRAAVGGSQISKNFVFAAVLPEKSAAMTIRNMIDHSLFALAGEMRSVEVPQIQTIERRIYRLDNGDLVSGSLEKGGVYLVALQGVMSAPDGKAAAIFLHDAPGSGLRPLGCALGAAAETGSLAWIGNLQLTPVLSCEKSGDGIEAVLANKEDGNWQAAYVAITPFSGEFTLAPAVARTSKDAVLSGGVATIEVK